MQELLQTFAYYRPPRQLTRTTSAPTLEGAWVEPTHRRYNTLGVTQAWTAGGLPPSPTGVRRVNEIHVEMQEGIHHIAPETDISMWHGRIYAMIHLRPRNPRAAMRRPQAWHVTLVRAWVEDGHAARTITRARVRRITDWMTWPNTMGLVPPPWRASWNFGVDAVLNHVLESVRHLVVAELLSLARELSIVATYELREIHASWN